MKQFFINILLKLFKQNINLSDDKIEELRFHDRKDKLSTLVEKEMSNGRKEKA